MSEDEEEYEIAGVRYVVQRRTDIIDVHRADNSAPVGPLVLNEGFAWEPPTSHHNEAILKEIARLVNARR
jgi:hypothetical protein